MLSGYIISFRLRQRPWAFEESVVRCLRRCEADWQEALELLQNAEVLNEYTDVPEMYEIISGSHRADGVVQAARF